MIPPYSLVSVPEVGLNGAFASALFYGLVSFANLAPAPPTPYSKFSIGDKTPNQVSGRQGMLLIYTPALLGLSYQLTSSSIVGERAMLVGGLLVAHFAKRVLETLLVHVYSGSVSGAVSGFIGIYYLLTSLMVTWVTQLVPDRTLSPEAATAGIVLFVVGEIGNLVHHVLLAQLRGPTKSPPSAAAAAGRMDKYKVPRGGLFEFVATPHYLFELIAWLGIAVTSQHLNAFLVFASMTSYLSSRAVQQAKWNRDNIRDYPRGRKNIVPGIF